MLNSSTLTSGALLRAVVVAALFVLVPLSADAQAELTCRAWTDNPIVSGATPLRAQHINEIRACLERIIEHLSVTPADPRGDITVSEVLRSSGSYSIYLTLFNNTTDRISVTVWTKVYGRNDELLDVVQSSGWRVDGGGRLRSYFYLNYYADDLTARGAQYYTMELTTSTGIPVLCSGCGRFPW